MALNAPVPDVMMVSWQRVKEQLKRRSEFQVGVPILKFRKALHPQLFFVLFHTFNLFGFNFTVFRSNTVAAPQFFIKFFFDAISYPTSHNLSND